MSRRAGGVFEVTQGGGLGGGIATLVFRGACRPWGAASVALAKAVRSA